MRGQERTARFDSAKELQAALIPALADRPILFVEGDAAPEKDTALLQKQTCSGRGGSGWKLGDVFTPWLLITKRRISRGVIKQFGG